MTAQAQKGPKQYPKPGEGTWSEHYELGTAPLSYENSISPEFYELEREAVFKRAWLNVGRVEQLRRKGSFFTKELAVANTRPLTPPSRRNSASVFFRPHRSTRTIDAR